MKILIVEPPPVSKFGNQRIFGGNGSNKSDFRKPPLDLMMISGYLRMEGYDNTLIDANASRKTLNEIKNLIQKENPDIIFFSTSTCTIYKDLLIAKIAKEIDKSIITVGIGTHIMALPEETFEESEYLDIGIYSGEWELCSLNIVKNIEDFKKIKGIYYRNSNGEIVKTDNQHIINDIDSLGFPSHDKLDKNLYGDPTSKNFPKTMVQGQKACINNCSFCCQPAFFGAPIVRRRSINHLIEELKWIKFLGFNEVMFNDATLTSDLKWAESLFEEMIKNNLNLTWNCSTRVDRINPEILDLMKKAGCHTIAIGMESIDPEVLKNIRKNVKSEQIRESVKLIRKHKMNSIVFCVIGFEGETKESIKKTISFLKTLDTTFITLGIAVPTPGTDFYKYVERNNYFLTKDWSLFDPMKKPVFSYPWLSSEDILNASRDGLRQFYLRPKYIIDRLKSIKSFSEFKSYFNNFIGFFQRYILQKGVK